MKSYKYIIVPLITLAFAQFIKFTFESIKYQKLNWGRLFNGAGGMPSSHSSFTASLAMMIGLNEGFNSPLFAISLVFSLVVAYDAMGLRMESGRHAERLNKITNQIFSKDFKIGLQYLKEELGHNPSEVFGGFVLAIFTTLSLNSMF